MTTSSAKTIAFHFDPSGFKEPAVPLSLFDYGEPQPPLSFFHTLPLIEYWANFYWLEQTDYPLEDAGPIVISHRVFEALRSAGDVECRVMPVRVYEHKKWQARRQHNPPWPRRKPPAYSTSVATGKLSDDFVAISEVVKIDCIDWSRADPDEMTGNAIDPSVTGLIAPPGGFPPVFSIRRSLGGTYYLSAAARGALDAIGARGIRFGKPLAARQP